MRGSMHATLNQPVPTLERCAWDGARFEVGFRQRDEQNDIEIQLTFSWEDATTLYHALLDHPNFQHAKEVSGG